jgi:hypothetical protein
MLGEREGEYCRFDFDLHSRAYDPSLDPRETRARDKEREVNKRNLSKRTDKKGTMRAVVARGGDVSEVHQ